MLALSPLLWISGLALILLGTVLVLLGALKLSRGRARVGGVLFVGPVPVVFGSDEQVAKWALILGLIVLALTLILFTLLPNFLP
ncbi:MAG: hypothetical protein B6U69_01190 [Thermofilum sp. ex4484_15]|nr:MAG: hypothetical protein B6U69_01190 [Thermofilum sp. ex4484_15]